MAKLKYTINSSRQYHNKEYPIFLRVSHKKQKIYISSKKSIRKEYWDQKNGSIIINTRNKDEKRKLQLLQMLLDEKMSHYRSSLLSLEINKPNYTFNDIVETLKDNYSASNVLIFFESTIKRLNETGKTGNAKAYSNTYGVFNKYRNEKDLTFDEFDYRQLIKFEEYLQRKNLKVNAISFHMRTLRALYNRAIKEGLAKEEIYPFKHYSIKQEQTSKRALVKQNLTDLKNLDLTNDPETDKARDYFLFSFHCRGMAFVDIAYLKVNNIVGDRIYYSRNKTNQKFSIKITSSIDSIIHKYNDLENPDSYIFPIIKDPDGDIYTQYRNGMRLTNKKLNKIGKRLELPIPLTTYVSRHSWATIAKREGIPTAIISEGLGHESEKTTQIYLDSFYNDVLDNANDMISNI